MNTILNEHGERVPMPDSTALVLLATAFHFPPPFTDSYLPAPIQFQALTALNREWSEKGIPRTPDNLKLYCLYLWRAIANEFKPVWIDVLLTVTATKRKVIL